MAKVALVGEIAFAGARVARALAKRGLAVRVLCPDSATEQAILRVSAPLSLPSPQEGEGEVSGAPGVEQQASIEVVRGALDAPAAVAEVLHGADGAGFVSPVTMAGRAYRPWQHLQDVRQFIEAAQTAGVRKVVYHSALGALAKAASRALRDAAAAEEVVKAGAAREASDPLFRYYLACTGPLMGPADGFLSEIVRKAKAGSPFAGVLGYGSTLVQPLHVDDFAQCFARFFLERPEELEAGRYALAGPETKTLLELLDMALARLGRMKLKFHAPLFVLAALAALSPRRPPARFQSRDRKGAVGPLAYARGSERGGIESSSEPAGLRERLSMLFDVFVTEHNDAPRLLGPGEMLLTPKQTQEEVLAAAAP